MEKKQLKGRKGQMGIECCKIFILCELDHDKLKIYIINSETTLKKVAKRYS